MPDAQPQSDLELLLAQREWVHALSRRLVGEGALAEDLAQDSMLRALSHPPRVDGHQQ